MFFFFLLLFAPLYFKGSFLSSFILQVSLDICIESFFYFLTVTFFSNGASQKNLSKVVRPLRVNFIKLEVLLVNYSFLLILFIV